MQLKRYLYFISIFSFFFFTQSFAAQSTMDVPVSPDLKESVLKKVRTDNSVLTVSNEEYVIGHGDVIAVSIYDEGDMSVNSPDRGGNKEGQAIASNGIVVRSDGRVSLKDIGDVEVVGLTFPQLADYLKALYSEIYDEPVLVTSLLQSNSRRYTVMGEINRPGTYRLDNPTNLVQVIAEAGGFSKWAGKTITVIRKELKDGDSKIFEGHKMEFDYDAFFDKGEVERNIYVRSGDVVVVE